MPLSKKQVPLSVEIRTLITEGKSDDQVWKVLRRRHPEIDESKRAYISWYRREMARKQTRQAA